METDRRAIAGNWVLAQAKRKLEQEEREAEYWAKRPMAHPSAQLSATHEIRQAGGVSPSF